MVIEAASDASDNDMQKVSEQEKRLRVLESRLESLVPAGLPDSLVYTGWDLWLASQKMPGNVPRLDGDEANVSGFFDRATERLASRGRSIKGVPFEVVNLGYVPIVQARGGAFDRRDDDDVPLERQVVVENRSDVLNRSSLYVPDDATKRAYGIIMPLDQGARSLRQESFYGPALSARRGAATHQLFVGDTFVSDVDYKNHASPLIFRHGDIARLLRSERTYVELVDRL